MKTVSVDRRFVLSLWNENSQICTAPHQVASWWKLSFCIYTTCSSQERWSAGNTTSILWGFLNGRLNIDMEGVAERVVLPEKSHIWLRWGNGRQIMERLVSKGKINYQRNHDFTSCQFSSVTQSCPTLCNPMDCSTPGFPVHHQLPELTQTHVHCIGDAIQPSHPLSSPSPPAFSLSQHQGLFQWGCSSGTNLGWRNVRANRWCLVWI